MGMDMDMGYGYGYGTWLSTRGISQDGMNWDGNGRGVFILLLFIAVNTQISM